MDINTVRDLFAIYRSTLNFKCENTTLDQNLGLFHDGVLAKDRSSTFDVAGLENGKYTGIYCVPFNKIKDRQIPKIPKTR